DPPLVFEKALVGRDRLPGDIKVVTANGRMATPAGLPLSQVENESIDALRADAAAILREDPDVVFLQEVRHHPAGTHTTGVAEQASVMAHLLGASDVVFIPAVARIDGLHEGYGTAIVLRNGAKFEQVFNGRLTNFDAAVEARSVGVAHVRFANGTDALLEGTHLANDPVKDVALRLHQLHDVGRIADQARATGTATYRDVLTGAEHIVKNLPRRGIIVAGDMNQLQQPTSEVLAQHGLTNVTDVLAGSGRPGAVQRAAEAAGPTAEHHGVYHRIDHVEIDDAFDVVDAGIIKLGGNLVNTGPTDHHFVATLLRRIVDALPKPAARSPFAVA
ncbi:MAG: hypothetical protein JWN41_1164, partial [Thermoleophilia bacterium]|nr:hypothetical protein [Thermoleophilia bacterium]